jgi:hypothetical protein
MGYLKLKNYSIYISLLPLLFLTACAGASGAIYTAMTDKLETEISGVKRSGDAQSIDNYEEYTNDDGKLLTYEDDLIKIEFPKNSNLYYVALAVENKSSNPVYIDWDEVEFIDADGEINDILKDGVKSERKSEEWSNGETVVEPGDREVHAFIPFGMYRMAGDYGDQYAFTCKGKLYDFEVTTMEFVQGGFNNPSKCSAINTASITVLQFANYTEPVGKNFSVVLPIRSGENVANYNIEFFVNETVET